MFNVNGNKTPFYAIIQYMWLLKNRCLNQTLVMKFDPTPVIQPSHWYSQIFYSLVVILTGFHCTTNREKYSSMTNSSKIAREWFLNQLSNSLNYDAKLQPHHQNEAAYQWLLDGSKSTAKPLLISLTTTVNPLLSPPGELIYFKSIWGGGGGGLIEMGSLFNLKPTMVSVLHKELDCKVEKLKYKKFSVMQPRIRIKSDLPVGK